MAVRTNVYESTFIVNAGLEDTQIDGVIERVKEAIVKNGGAVRDMAKWGRKRFVYPIKRKSNGFYVVIEFEGPGDLIAKLERHYQLDESIIRYLTIHHDRKTLTYRVAVSEMFKQSGPSTPAAPAPAPPKEETVAPVAPSKP